MAAFAAVSPLTIAWKPKAGTVIKFKSNAKGSAGGQDFTVDASLVQTTKEVKSDGNVVVETKQTTTSAMFGGNDVSSQIPEVTETSTQKPNGEVVSKESDSPMKQPRMDAMTQFIYPDHAVDIGDSWTFNAKGDKDKGTYDVEIKFTFQGQEKVGDINCDKIAFDAAEKGADAPISAKGTMWVDAENGEMVKSSSQVKNVPFGPGGTGDMELTTVRA